MRLFIAALPDAKVTKSLIAAMHDLKKAGVGGAYSTSANLHMTLAFIGEVPDAKPVKEALEKLTIERFSLGLDGSGNFGNLLYASAKGNQKMKAAVKAIRSQLAADKIPHTKESFVPHITLVRNASRVLKFPVEKAEMEVSRISLMRSDTKDGKVVYREIFSTSCR